MTESAIIDIANQTMQVALLIALPLLGVSLVTGLLISLVQVATSIQDVTLTFVPKIIAIALVLIFSAHWILQTLISFTYRLLSDLTQVVS